MNLDDKQLVALCREWAASPIGLTILGTLADRIEALSGGVEHMTDALDRIDEIAANSDTVASLRQISKLARAGLNGKTVEARKGSKMTPKKAAQTPVWCDHCAAEISPSGVRSCMRETCGSKAVLAKREKAA